MHARHTARYHSKRKELLVFAAFAAFEFTVSGYDRECKYFPTGMNTRESLLRSLGSLL